MSSLPRSESHLNVAEAVVRAPYLAESIEHNDVFESEAYQIQYMAVDKGRVTGYIMTGQTSQW